MERGSKDHYERAIVPPAKRGAAFVYCLFSFLLYFMFVFSMLSFPGDINVKTLALYPLLWGVCARVCVCVLGGGGAIKMV